MIAWDDLELRFHARCRVWRSYEQNVVRPAAWDAFGLLPWQRELLEHILSERPDVALASLGVPYVLNDFPGAAVRICTYSDVPISQDALASFLVE